VTGAAGGIGAAIALALAQRGIVPVLAVREPAAARAAVDACQAVGAEAHAVRCDVGNGDSTRAAVAECIRLTGALDILVNNAGRIDPIGRLADVDPEAWAEAVSVNLGGAFRMLHAALPHLLQSTRGVVVNISSGAAHTPREGWSAYCSAKAGLAMLTRCVALEYPGLASYGFQPGVVDTDMQVKIRASGINEISRIPRDQLAPAARPAAFVAWLCDVCPADLVGVDLRVNDPALEARIQEASA
jgi:NAD(P)-dependent dehydrogenase (short-subunit alcohol dehydrogenase family)